MESKDLLHPEKDQNQEVNSGTSPEVHDSTEHSNQPTSEIENTLIEQEPVNKAGDTVSNETPTESLPATSSLEEKTDDKIKKEQKKHIPETSESVSDMMSDIESSQEVENEEEEEEKEEENIEKIEADYKDLTLQEAVDMLTAIVTEPDYNKIKLRVGILKAKILYLLKEHKQELLEAYIADGGNKDDFVPEISEWEKQFNDALHTFKNNKAKFIEELELQKQKNLERKKHIIDSLKELVENESNLKVLNDKFKEFQEQWKEIGPVPQNESTNLWQNYHFYVEKFFDILRLNKELRSLDLKKNLEQKILLCETAESLLLKDSINKSFKALQQLHDEWKEIGPVPEDKKEEIWERFKNASDQINARRREYYDKLYEEQQNNYNAKVVLCEQAEELIAREVQSVKEYNEISEKLTELLKVWKTLGPAPAKLNDEVWMRFKSTLDKFFQGKKEFFQTMKETQMQNYNLKLNLTIRAEAIATRTDWKQATDELLAIQKEWKEIGATPRKYSEAIWKRFRTACDHFFEAKSNYFSNVKEIEAENLQKKEELINRINEHVFGEDKEENLEVMKAFQREWTELGHVPRKDKDRIYSTYREAVNNRFADLKMNVEDIRRDRYKSKIGDILNNPNADKILDKEKRFLINKMNQLKDDIILWENNLGFFANSKNADILKAEFVKKIELAKEQVKELEYKIRMMKAEAKADEKAKAAEEAKNNDVTESENISKNEKDSKSQESEKQGEE